MLGVLHCLCGFTAFVLRIVCSYCRSTCDRKAPVAILMGAVQRWTAGAREDCVCMRVLYMKAGTV